MACVHYLDWAEAQHPPKQVGHLGTTRIFTSGFTPISGNEKLKIITHRLLKTNHNHENGIYFLSNCWVQSHNLTVFICCGKCSASWCVPIQTLNIDISQHPLIRWCEVKAIILNCFHSQNPQWSFKTTNNRKALSLTCCLRNVLASGAECRGRGAAEGKNEVSNTEWGSFVLFCFAPVTPEFQDIVIICY